MEKIDSFRGAASRERERGRDRVVSGGSRVNIFRRNQLGEVIMGRFAEKIRSDPCDESQAKLEAGQTATNRAKSN